MKPSVHPFQTDDSRLRAVHEKVVAGQRLELGEVTSLYASKDILAIGWLANYVRERKHGNVTRYNVDSIGAQVETTGSEFVVVGGDFERTCRTVESLRAKWPTAKISACTVEELAHPGAMEKVRALHQAGANSLLGSGAELFLPALRKSLWQSKGSWERRAEVRGFAKNEGLAVALYLVQRPGTAEQQALELLSFREQPGDEFAAISFEADGSTSPNLAATTGMQEMKHIAIARLALGHVSHIKAYWQMLGGKLLQIALRFGASHVDGTALDAAVDGNERASELAREVQVAGQEPHGVPAVTRVVVSA